MFNTRMFRGVELIFGVSAAMLGFFLLLDRGNRDLSVVPILIGSLLVIGMFSHWIVLSRYAVCVLIGNNKIATQSLSASHWIWGYRVFYRYLIKATARAHFQRLCQEGKYLEAYNWALAWEPGLAAGISARAFEEVLTVSIERAFYLAYYVLEDPVRYRPLGKKIFEQRMNEHDYWGACKFGEYVDEASRLGLFETAKKTDPIGAVKIGKRMELADGLIREVALVEFQRLIQEKDFHEAAKWAKRHGLVEELQTAVVAFLPEFVLLVCDRLGRK